jgi:hypothetical protein
MSEKGCLGPHQYPYSPLRDDFRVARKTDSLHIKLCAGVGRSRDRTGRTVAHGYFAFVELSYFNTHLFMGVWHSGSAHALHA